MGHPISVRLEDEVQATLEMAAKERGVGLSTYLRDLAASEAARVRRDRIRRQSRAVADYIGGSEDAQAFYRDWGSGLDGGDGS
jgi:hypothetical protein